MIRNLPAPMDSIPFYCFGISHRSADAELRAGLALSPDRQKTLLETIAASSAAGGAVALSTCNRTEIYFSLMARDEAQTREEPQTGTCSGDERPDAGARPPEQNNDTSPENEASAAFLRLDTMLARIAGCDLHLLRRHLRYYMGTSALEHLLKVASGADSVNLGENEIAGQIARAYDLARSAGSTDFLLNLAFQQTLRRARKLRSKAGFAGSGLSYASLAATEAERRIREEAIEDPVILLIGAGGQLGSAIMRTILSRDLGRLRITVRRGGDRHPALSETPADSAFNNSGSAPDLAPDASRRVQIVDYARRYECMRDADIIISCTASPHHTVTYREFLEAAAPGRKYLLEDLSLPRDMDADLGNLSNVTLKDFAWFSDLAASHRRRRLGGARLIAHDIRSEAQELAWLIRRKALERDSLPRLGEFLDAHDGKTLFYLLQKAAEDPQELETLLDLARRGAACSRNLRRRD